MFDPYYMPQGQQLNQVSGVDDVLAAQIPRGSTVAFFHRNEDIFFIKSSDDQGRCGKPRAFRFSEIDIDDLMPVTLTRAEFAEMKEMLKNAQLIIQQQQSGQAVQPAETGQPNRQDTKPVADPTNAQKRKS